jgi:malate synthase
VFKRLRQQQYASEKTLLSEISQQFLQPAHKVCREFTQNSKIVMNQTVASPKVKTGNVQIKGVLKPGYEKILTPEALEFLGHLHSHYNQKRLALLEQRKLRQQRLDAGEFPTFLNFTEAIRDSNWKIDPIPACLEDRRVEITGPVDRKMIINALNSGASVFMADFEDSTSPTWENIIEGQLNLKDAARKNISFTSPEGKSYNLDENVAVLKVRPRGWHLEESHILIDGLPASASLVDFGLFVFHNGALLAEQKQGPFFYLPKLENHLEARLWNNVFTTAEQTLGIADGTIKATVLIETITAAFEMEEILYELRQHMAGLNAGRWDYIFSVIKKFNKHPEFVLPDRLQVTMNVPFMKAYAQLLVKTCHKRGAHAIGGMSAFIPSKDEAINQAAYEKVKADKEREASQGYDGTWVAHPKLVDVARTIFDAALKDKPNQKHVLREDFAATAKDLLDIRSANGQVTEAGFRTNVNVALLYIDSWLRGIGAAALYNLMEDAATAEISRAQLWQWIQHKVRLEDGRTATSSLYQTVSDEEYEKIREQFKATDQDTLSLSTARLILDRLVLNPTFEDFLTLKAYLHIR